MTDMGEVTQLPSDFDGRVRVFPLPNLVVFPHAMQPLHVFEPRYCEMLLESLASDRLIAMATLATKGGLAKTEGPLSPPALEQYVCIGRVISHVTSEDETHNVLLLGAQRARLRHELETGRAFRMAEVEVIPDVYPPPGAPARQQLRRRVLNAFRDVIPDAGEVHKNLHELMAGQMPLGPITDIIAYTMHFPSSIKLDLLGEGDVDQRAERLAETLERLAAEKEEVAGSSGGNPFPPPFSSN